MLCGRTPSGCLRLWRGTDVTNFPLVTVALLEASVADSFTRALKRVTRAYWGGFISRDLFDYTFSNEINHYLYRAFLMGARDMGVSESELLSSERFICRLKIAGQMAQIRPFAEFIEDNSMARGGKLPKLYARLSLWTNQFLAMRNFARMLVGGNKKAIWILGPTEHCSSCLKLAGLVFRASEWRAAEVYPQSPDLECKGFKCQCQLKPTDAARSAGEVPAIP